MAHINYEKIAQIRKLIAAGRTKDEIAAELNMSRNNVYHFTEYYNLAVEKKAGTKAVRNNDVFRKPLMLEEHLVCEAMICGVHRFEVRQCLQIIFQQNRGIKQERIKLTPNQLQFNKRIKDKINNSRLTQPIIKRVLCKVEK